MSSSVRAPAAPHFYRGDTKKQLASFLAGFAPSPKPLRPVAGVVPHAGWFFSGRTAALVFRNLVERRDPRTFVLLGAVHRWGVRGPSVYPSGSWEVPGGAVTIDEELATALLDSAPEILQAAPRAHADEHSLEVQLPMIRALAPDARIVPVAVPTGDAALAVGDTIAAVLKTRGEPAAGGTVVVGSTDLTHYGESYGFAPAGTGPAAQRWMRANDERILALAQRMAAADLLEEAAVHHNACGSGAWAATIRAAAGLGAGEGVLVDYTTSHDVAPDGPFQMAVGYAGMLY